MYIMSAWVPTVQCNAKWFVLNVTFWRISGPPRDQLLQSKTIYIQNGPDDFQDTIDNEPKST